MVGDQVAGSLEPEQREAGEHATLVGDRARKHDVECADPIRRHEEEAFVACLIHVAHLSPRVKVHSRLAHAFTSTFSRRSNTTSGERSAPSRADSSSSEPRKGSRTSV